MKKIAQVPESRNDFELFEDAILALSGRAVKIQDFGAYALFLAPQLLFL